MLGLKRGKRTPHELRREFLDSLAVLIGYTHELDTGLPDGRRPDVLRIDFGSQRIFVGDAKDSESPKDLDTRVRLLGYFRWLSMHVVARGGYGTLAICFGNRRHVDAWKSTLIELAHEAGMPQVGVVINKFDPALFVAWCDASVKAAPNVGRYDLEGRCR